MILALLFNFAMAGTYEYIPIHKPFICTVKYRLQGEETWKLLPASSCNVNSIKNRLRIVESDSNPSLIEVEE